METQTTIQNNHDVRLTDACFKFPQQEERQECAPTFLYEEFLNTFKRIVTQLDIASILTKEA